MRRKSWRKRCSPGFTAPCSSGHQGNQNGTFLLVLQRPVHGPDESMHGLWWDGWYWLCWPGDACSIGSRGCCVSGSSSMSCPVSIAHALSSCRGVQYEEPPCLRLKSLWSVVGQVLLSCRISDVLQVALQWVACRQHHLWALSGRRLVPSGDLLFESMSHTTQGHPGTHGPAACLLGLSQEQGMCKPLLIQTSFLCRNDLKRACSFLMLVHSVGFKAAC